MQRYGPDRHGARRRRQRDRSSRRHRDRRQTKHGYENSCGGKHGASFAIAFMTSSAAEAISASLPFVKPRRKPRQSRRRMHNADNATSRWPRTVDATATSSKPGLADKAT